MKQAMKENRIRQKTVVEQLMQEIRQMITNGEYKINDRLPTEQELADKFGVGRSSVREAIKMLTHLGILESHTSQGTYLRGTHRVAEVAAAWSVILGYEKMKEVFTLGSALDSQVVIILLEAIRNEPGKYTDLIDEVKVLIQRMHLAAGQNDLDDFQESFAAYFRTIYEATGNMVFVALNDCIESLIVKKVCTAYFETGKLEEASDYLEKIWQSVLGYSLYDSIRYVQDYGAFAYNTFAIFYEEENG
jgi:GntR family transcriptional repressor for pyruvate dehydrogenase complex